MERHTDQSKAHNRDYKNTAAKHGVSYSQVYSWVKKYDANGEDGLTDRRGHRETDDEVNELERLRPGFTAMMEEAETGNVEAIIIKDMSRLGRDYLKVGQVMEILWQRNGYLWDEKWKYWIVDEETH